MQYRDRINDLTQKIDSTLADFNAERIRGNMPTQISSEFLTTEPLPPKGGRFNQRLKPPKARLFILIHF